MFIAFRGGLVCLSLALGGCSYLRTPYALQQLNSPSGSSEAPKRPEPSERIARIVQTHIQDSYFDVAAVEKWSNAALADKEPLLAALDCVRKNRPNVIDCYGTGFDMDAPVAWALPPPPIGPAGTPPLLQGTKTDPAALTELDVERFLGNARWIASSLLVMEDSLGRPLLKDELAKGIEVGFNRAIGYLKGRNWHRETSRPRTALVMSGGAATGGFTAGFVSRLMDVLQVCKNATGDKACPDASVDLIVGTSTGSLVGVLFDKFQEKNQQEAAHRMLIDNYTCSTERDLYCKHDEWDWRLFEHMRGLMRFNGIEKKLTEALPASPTESRASELVTLSVDFESGDLIAQSDQDPADQGTKEDRVQAVLASIVEPVFADPVEHLRNAGQPVSGTFIDAGVRSALPMREAVWRGAERTLIISTANVDIGPSTHPTSALDILLRTIDLATSQNFAGELQQAEFEAAARRLAEYDVCIGRLNAVKDATALREFCERKNLFILKATDQGFTGGTIGPGTFSQVANSWQSTWVNRPEPSGPGAVGFSFDPPFMRNLFKWGARTFQKRCHETLRLLNVPAVVRNEKFACGMTADEAAVQAENSFRPLASCHPDEHEILDCK